MRLEQRLPAEEIISRYRAGVSANGLARDLGVHTSTVTRWLRRQGIQTRTQSESCQLAYEMDPKLRERVGRPRQYILNESFFDSFTDSSAYILGFIQADGTVGEDRFSITQARKSRGFMASLAIEMGSSRPLQEVKQTAILPGGRPFKQKAVRVVVNSRHMADSIRGWGIASPRQIDAVLDPQLLEHPAFWRGVVDGDGTLHVTRVRRRPVLIIRGTPPVCYGFQRFLLARGVYSAAEVGLCSRTARCWRYRVSDSIAVRAASLLYEAAGPVLPRKWSIYDRGFRG